MILNMPGKRPENLKELLRYINLLEEQLRFILGNIDGSDISPGTIGSDQLADGVVTATHIAAESITVEKISPGTGSALDISSNKAITLAAKKLEEAGDAIAQLVIETDKISTKVADAEGNISTLQQTAQSLESRVQDTEGNVSSLQQTAKGFELRVESTEETLEGLGTRVTEAEASLTVQAGQISLKASKTEVDSLTGRITNAEAQIVTQAGEIQLTATEVSNISVGGTNILPGYAEERTVYQFFSVPVANIFQGHEGEDVCISFECKATVARSLQLYPYQALGLSIADAFNFVPSATEFTRHAFVTKVKKWPDVTTGYVGNSIAIYDYAGGQNFTIRKFKIELGNKPTDWSPHPDDPVKTLKNTAMTLNADGIEMTTTGHFRLYANDGKNSRIKLGGDDETANFSVDETGKLGAVSGAFANGLTVGGQGVWTRGNIIISSSQPTGVHDVLWLQPLQGVQQISHNLKPENNTSMVHNQQYPFTLTPVSTDVLSNGGSYVYTMQIEVARIDDGKGFKNYTFKSVLTTSAGSVTLTSGTISMGSGGNASITMTVQSTTNLFATAGNVEAKISVTAPETGSTGLYIKRGMDIKLTSKNTTASSAGAQTCTIHYIQ